MDTVTRKRSAK